MRQTGREGGDGGITQKERRGDRGITQKERRGGVVWKQWMARYNTLDLKNDLD